MSRIFLPAFFLFLTACGSTSAIRVKEINKIAINPTQRDFILITTSDFDNDFRLAMNKHNLSVKKYTSTETKKTATTTKTKDGTKEEAVYRSAGARYAIEMRVDVNEGLTCLHSNSARHVEVRLEISDTVTNDVLFELSQVGWTEECGLSTVGQKQFIFQNIADELGRRWAI